MTREEIEQAWMEDFESNDRVIGFRGSLCEFLAKKHKPLRERFESVWGEVMVDRFVVFISDYYKHDVDQEELSYLLRALTLNILLDDNPNLLS